MEEVVKKLKFLTALVEEGGRIKWDYDARVIRQTVTALEKAEKDKNAAYLERNRLVALLASLYPSGTSRTDIEGWSPDWHQVVYIDFPWGQASWHFHDSQAYLFDHLPPYEGVWDGHTTESKYAGIREESLDIVRYEKLD